MQTLKSNKIIFYTALAIICLLLLANCKPFKQLANNQPIYTKKARIVPGNAKNFQLRKAAKEKKLQTKKLYNNDKAGN